MCDAGSDAAMVQKIFRAIRGSMKTQNEKIGKLQMTIASLEVELQTLSHPEMGSIRVKIGNSTTFLSMLQTENEGLRHELDSNNDGVKDIQGMINLVEAQSEKLQHIGEQIQDFEAHIKAMRSRSLSGTRSLSKGSTLDLTSTANTFEHYAASNASASRSTSKVAKLPKRTTFDMKDVFDSMKREYNHIHDDNQQLQTEVAAVAAKYRDLQGSFETLSKTRHTELASARAERKQRRQNSNRMTNELYALKQQLAQSHETTAKLQHELGRANKALSAKATELKRAERQSRAAHETHQRGAETKLNEVGALQTQLAKSLGTEMLSKNELRASREGEQQLKDSLCAAQQKIDDLVGAVGEAKEQQKEAAQESRAMTETIEQQKNALAKCRAENKRAVEAMKQSLVAKERELGQALHGKVEVEQLVAQKEKQAMELSQALSELQASCVSQDEKVKSMRAEKVALLAGAQSGERMQNMLKQQLDAFRKEMEAQQHEIASLQVRADGVAQIMPQKRHENRQFGFAFN